MEVFAMLFASQYGVAALGSVTLAAGMLVASFVLLSRKATSTPPGEALRANPRA